MLVSFCLPAPTGYRVLPLLPHCTDAPAPCIYRWLPRIYTACHHTARLRYHAYAVYLHLDSPLLLLPPLHSVPRMHTAPAPHRLPPRRLLSAATVSRLCATATWISFWVYGSDLMRPTATVPAPAYRGLLSPAHAAVLLRRHRVHAIHTAVACHHYTANRFPVPAPFLPPAPPRITLPAHHLPTATTIWAEFWTGWTI